MPLTFQSTRPRGARLHNNIGLISTVVFQSTRPRGARRFLIFPIRARPSFNPRAHVGRDFLATHTQREPSCFNPRAHVGRDNGDFCTPSPPGTLFQSTRPRGARHGNGRQECADAGVSIHAPTWGATASMGEEKTIRTSFNPRAHVGRDCITGRFVVFFAWFQSTRPRGARRPGCVYYKSLVSFQSTRPRGARLPMLFLLYSLMGRFNPRAHVGRDKAMASIKPDDVRFNPRAHVGRDVSSMVPAAKR